MLCFLNNFELNENNQNLHNQRLITYFSFFLYLLLRCYLIVLKKN